MEASLGHLFLWNQLKKVVKDHVGAGTVLTTAGPSLLPQKGGFKNPFNIYSLW